MKHPDTYRVVLKKLEDQIDEYTDKPSTKELDEILTQWAKLAFEAMQADKWRNASDIDKLTVMSLPEDAYEWRDWSHQTEMLNCGLLCIRERQICYTELYTLTGIRAKRGDEWCNNIEPKE